MPAEVRNQLYEVEMGKTWQDTGHTPLPSQRFGSDGCSEQMQGFHERFDLFPAWERQRSCKTEHCQDLLPSAICRVFTSASEEIRRCSQVTTEALPDSLAAEPQHIA